MPTKRKSKRGKRPTKQEHEYKRASMRASDDALSEFHRDARCNSRHVPNCNCRGDARKPIKPNESAMA